MSIEGATTRETFGVYMECFLAAALSPVQVVIMDNLGAHRSRSVRELIKATG